MTDSITSLDQTRAWVERFVVAHDICPFARRELERDSIRYVMASAENLEEALLALIDECRRLDDDPSIETTLLVLPNGVEDFDDYLDLLGLAEGLLEDQGYEGVYQLASFHPDYCFHGVDEDDPANYTNRSPHPMLHLLREASIERVLASFAHPERIPERNAALLRGMGRASFADDARALKSDD
ncbi:hypothetical protein SAMN02745148_01523 [Modicisalibacter ilicicola DSM 19980]|uniref:DUF1415 domain-containing protein n=1 Tax=Modicisalibacter ilicicola DSM 19980 TaxID=1121942 RepID=A0A1M4XZF0_9GAMM|nr:DUF1415 domain-containing protein [Halomonas ilicicola]SHE98716.1 hypothetical protein SAMN02745148_01523 [Halomonas ilicicola DSM 19980]